MCVFSQAFLCACFLSSFCCLAFLSPALFISRIPTVADPCPCLQVLSLSPHSVILCILSPALCASCLACHLTCLPTHCSKLLISCLFCHFSLLSLVFLSPLLDVTSPPYHPGPLVSQKPKYKGQLESMLIQHVVPEFQSQHGYL